ncbi:MAG: hypothetical protein IPL55_10900 [Saprospiraceae bacterium]|nr:hypothetical protein [Saprospiraceae bacterium]
MPEQISLSHLQREGSTTCRSTNELADAQTPSTERFYKTTSLIDKVVILSELAVMKHEDYDAVLIRMVSRLRDLNR